MIQTHTLGGPQKIEAYITILGRINVSQVTWGGGSYKLVNSGMIVCHQFQDRNSLYIICSEHFMKRNEIIHKTS